MPCYYPLSGWRSKLRNPKTGGRSIVFSASKGLPDRPVSVPCGRCVGCRLEYARQWAVRCYHESLMYDDNHFVTLTYAPEHLPKDGSVSVPELQNFMKRLRKKYGEGVRFFGCGEYGDRTWRPHYHLCLFNLPLSDLRRVGRGPKGHPYYTSSQLEKCWGRGSVTIGSLTYDSAGYTARYVMKKQKGDQEHQTGHEIRCPMSGVVLERLKPEFCRMSTGREKSGGIGKPFYEKFKDDIYPHGYVVVNDRKMQPPKYYDDLYARDHPIEFRKLKQRRSKERIARKADNTSSRQRVKEIVKLAQIEHLHRDLDL